MAAVNMFVITAVLILSPALLVRQTRGQRLGVQPQASSPFSKVSWGGPAGSAPYHNRPATAQERKAGADVIAKEPGSDLPEPPKNLDGFLYIDFPKVVSDKEFVFLKKEERGKGNPHGLDMPKELQEAKYQTYKGGKNVIKPPLVTAGFVLKKNEKGGGMKLMKQEVNPVGTGLSERPLDKPVDGDLFQKHFHHPESMEKTFATSAEDDLGAKFEGVSSERSTFPDGRQVAVEMIQKGLGAVREGLFKTGTKHIAGLAHLKEGLDQLSKGFGSGDPRKDIDVAMVKRGLDRLGAGLLKRGLDIAGLGLVKRGVDDLYTALAEASMKKLQAALGELRKGMDQVYVELVKNGFDKDGVSLITTGAENLATWLMKHAANAKTAPTPGTLRDKPEFAPKRNHNKDSKINRQSADKSDAGLPTGDTGSDFMTKSYDFDVYDDFISVRDFHENPVTDSKYTKASSVEKYASFLAALGEDKQDKAEEMAGVL